MKAFREAHGEICATDPCQRCELRARAIAIGRDIARKVFAKRGNRAEAHLSELELASMLAVAAERGLEGK